MNKFLIFYLSLIFSTAYSEHIHLKYESLIVAPGQVVNLPGVAGDIIEMEVEGHVFIEGTLTSYGTIALICPNKIEASRESKIICSNLNFKSAAEEIYLNGSINVSGKNVTINCPSVQIGTDYRLTFDTDFDNVIDMDAPVVILRHALTENVAEITGTAIMVWVTDQGVIQNGIDISTENGYIDIDTGIFVEDLFIDKNLTLMGDGPERTFLIGLTSDQSKNTFTFHNFVKDYHPCILVEDSDCVIIQNLSLFTLESESPELKRIGIVYSNSGGIIENVYCHERPENEWDINSYGVLAVDSHAQASSLTVKDCTFKNFELAAICAVDLKEVIFENNTIEGSKNDDFRNTYGLLSSHAKCLIKGNRIRNLYSTHYFSTAIKLIHPAFGTSVESNAIDSCDNGVIVENAEDSFSLIENTFIQMRNYGADILFSLGHSIIARNTFEMDKSFRSVCLSLFCQESKTFKLTQNLFRHAGVGLYIEGNKEHGPLVSMEKDSFYNIQDYYIEMADAPHDVWPSSSGVSFDGKALGEVSYENYLKIRNKIYDQLDENILGLALDFIDEKSKTQN